MAYHSRTLELPFDQAVAATTEARLQAFDILHLNEHDSEIREGAGHNGMAALVDLVARKPKAP